ncbi:MAG: PAS domain-containing sensor histidine kinase [Cyanobacteria bacterium P01_D01_bin.116]
MLTPPDWKDVDRKMIEQIKKKRVCNPVEKEYFRKDGSRVPIVLGSFLLENSTNTGVSFVLDITGRKQIEKERAQLLISEREARKQAEAANSAKDEFVAVVSHDLRSPLNAILGWLEILRRNIDNLEMRNQAIEIIERSARTQDILIQDLLDISRITQNTIELKISPVNLQSIVKEEIDSIYPIAIAKNIQLESEIDSTINTTMGDANRLQQIFGNLLSNAIKFTPESGNIKVCLQQVKNIAQIIVSDTGKGISSELLPYIFERFRQANDIETKQKGLGLGLAIAYHLVKLHNGTIKANSAGEGKGTTFVVSLPLYSEQ